MGKGSDLYPNFCTNKYFGFIIEESELIFRYISYGTQMIKIIPACYEQKTYEKIIIFV